MSQAGSVIQSVSFQSASVSAGNSLYSGAFESQEQWYKDVMGFMVAFTKGEEVVFPGGVRCDLSSLEGITVATQYIDLKRNFMELVTKTFEYVKSFEKSLSNSI